LDNNGKYKNIPKKYRRGNYYVQKGKLILNVYIKFPQGGGKTKEIKEEIIKELNEAKANFLQGAVEDNKAYMLIANAYKLPKASDEEKEIRKKAIQNAGIEAAKVPLSNALLNKKE